MRAAAVSLGVGINTPTPKIASPTAVAAATFLQCNNMLPTPSPPVDIRGLHVPPVKRASKFHPSGLSALLFKGDSSAWWPEARCRGVVVTCALLRVVRDVRDAASRLLSEKEIGETKKPSAGLHASSARRQPQPEVVRLQCLCDTLVMMSTWLRPRAGVMVHSTVQCSFRSIALGSDSTCPRMKNATQVYFLFSRRIFLLFSFLPIEGCLRSLADEILGLRCTCGMIFGPVIYRNGAVHPPPSFWSTSAVDQVIFLTVLLLMSDL